MSKIKWLRDPVTKEKIAPKTSIKAIFDDTGRRLDRLLANTVLMENLTEDEEDELVVPEVGGIEADILGGKYTADSIDAMNEELLTKISLEVQNRKTHITQEAASMKAEIDVQRERIDQLVRTENSDTTENAELLDIRIGADGVTYSTAGEAVRTQLANIPDILRNRINNILHRVNLFDKESVIEKYCYNSTIGTPASFVSNTNFSAYTTIFDVSEGDIYTTNWLYMAFYIFDENRNLIQYSYNDTVPCSVTIPSGAKYMSIAGATSEMDGVMLVNSDTLPDKYVGYNVFDISVTSDISSKKLKGVNWVAFGDSLTDSSTLADELTGSKNYVDFVSESLELNVTNCGKGGTGYKKTSNNFCNRVSTIPSDVQILTVFGSFNDYDLIDSCLGTINDTTTDTLYGSMKVFFDTVYTNFPDIIIGIILPTKWGYLSYQKDSVASEKCDKYIKALIDVANYYSIPVLDLYNQSNLRPWDENFTSKYYKDDDNNGEANSVHPLSIAHKKFIAPKVEDFIKRIYNEY